MSRPPRDSRAPHPIVPAHLKMLPHRGYAVILCGRISRPNRGICGGDLGRVHALPLAGQEFNDLDLVLPDGEEFADLLGELNDREPPKLLHNPDNLDDPTNYALTAVGDRDFPTLSGLLRLGLSGVSPDDFVDIEDGTIGLWVAWHERGYTRLQNGDYTIIMNPDHERGAWRRDSEGRARGRSAIPDHLLHDVDQSELALFSGYASRSGFTVTWDGTPPKLGVIGARPHLPAVIICLKDHCGARNAVPRLEVGTLSEEVKRSAEAARSARIYRAFASDHPPPKMEDTSHLSLRESEMISQKRFKERKALYRQWFKDDGR